VEPYRVYSITGDPRVRWRGRSDRP